MIAAATLSTGTRTAPRACAAMRRRPAQCCEQPPPAAAATRAAPRQPARALADFLGDGLPAPAPARAADAARGFAAGDGYYKGALVDRFI